MSESPDVVVKVGGSLYDLPDLGPRLRSWLGGLGTVRVVIIPGGGAAADVVRDLDRLHELGGERSHWLALASLSLTGRFLWTLLPGAAFVAGPEEADAAWRAGAVAVLDPHAFARADEGQIDSLPHDWSATSDSVAARVAVAWKARQLVLLKSVSLPPGVDWTEAGRLGLVDTQFAGVVGQARGLSVRWENLRSGRP